MYSAVVFAVAHAAGWLIRHGGPTLRAMHKLLLASGAGRKEKGADIACRPVRWDCRDGSYAWSIRICLGV